LIASVLGILAYFGITPFTRDRPSISILKVDSFFHEDLMETRFVLKNTGKIAAYFKVDGQASINDTPVRVKEIQDHPNIIMPGQIIRYRGLTIQGDTYKRIMKKESSDKIIQSVDVKYGSSKNNTNKYFTLQKVELDLEKIPNQNKHPQTLQGIWILKESDGK